MKHVMLPAVAIPCDKDAAKSRLLSQTLTVNILTKVCWVWVAALGGFAVSLSIAQFDLEVNWNIQDNDMLC